MDIKYFICGGANAGSECEDCGETELDDTAYIFEPRRED